MEVFHYRHMADNGEVSTHPRWRVSQDFLDNYQGHGLGLVSTASSQPSPGELRSVN